MPGVSRKGDVTTGHSCFPPMAAIEGSDKVFIGGIGALRVGDAFPVHACGNSAHDGAVASGSAKVFCEGLALARIGDDVTCGDALAQGGTKVFSA